MRGQRVSESDRIAIVLKMRHGWSSARICARYNLNESTVTRIRQEAGVKTRSRHMKGTRGQDARARYEALSPIVAYMDTLSEFQRRGVALRLQKAIQTGESLEHIA